MRGVVTSYPPIVTAACPAEDATLTVGTGAPTDISASSANTRTIESVVTTASYALTENCDDAKPAIASKPPPPSPATAEKVACPADAPCAGWSDVRMMLACSAKALFPRVTTASYAATTVEAPSGLAPMSALGLFAKTQKAASSASASRSEYSLSETQNSILAWPGYTPVGAPKAVASAVCEEMVMLACPASVLVFAVGAYAASVVAACSAGSLLRGGVGGRSYRPRRPRR